MSRTIVNESTPNVNSFSEFEAKVQLFARRVHARYTTQNDGDKYSATVYGAPTVRIYGRPGSKTALALVGYDKRTAKQLELK